MLGKGGGGGGHLRRGRRREEQVCLQSHYDLPVTCCDFCIILRTHVHEQHPGCDHARLQPPIASRPLQGDLDIVNVTLPYIEMAVNIRSEERRVGKECVSTCRSRWSPLH